MDAIMRKLPEVVPDAAQRRRVYEVLIPAMQDQDWDTETDCLDVDPAYDAALKALHPKWFDGSDHD